MPEPFRFTDAQKVTYREQMASNATDSQWSYFITECERRQLVPGVHVIFRLEPAEEFSKELQRTITVNKVILITTINALRLIAERPGKYAGHGPFIYYYKESEVETLKESKIPYGKEPFAVSVEGYRNDWSQPLFTTARYAALVQTTSTGHPTAMWRDRGEEQLAKCCEAAMLRTIAPEECGGLYIAEEFDRKASASSETATAAVVVPTATLAPTVNQGAAPVEPVKTLVPESGNRIQTTRLPPAPAIESSLFGVSEPQMKPAPVVIPANPTPAPTPAPVADTPKPQVTVAQPVAAVPTGDEPATALQYATFVNQRATKIIRDVLPKAGMKDAEAANATKNYLLKQSGKTVLKHISAATFERLISALENATPEQAAQIVRDGSK